MFQRRSRLLLLGLFAACTPLYPGTRPADPRPPADAEACRTLSRKFATSGGLTKVAGPLAALGGVTAAVLGATDHQGPSAAAGGTAMLMAVTAAVSGILHESSTLEYVDRCTVNQGGVTTPSPAPRE